MKLLTGIEEAVEPHPGKGRRNEEENFKYYVINRIRCVCANDRMWRIRNTDSRERRRG